MVSNQPGMFLEITYKRYDWPMGWNVMLFSQIIGRLNDGDLASSTKRNDSADGSMVPGTANATHSLKILGEQRERRHVSFPGYCRH